MLSYNNVLKLPGLSHPVIVICDTSKLAVGFPLVHIYELGGHRPRDFGDYKLNEREKATEMECLTIVEVIKTYLLYE